MTLAIVAHVEREQPSILPRRHLLDLDDWSPEELRAVLDAAKGMREVLRRPERRLDTLRGHVLVNLFYEKTYRCCWGRRRSPRRDPCRPWSCRCRSPRRTRCR